MGTTTEEIAMLERLSVEWAAVAADALQKPKQPLADMKAGLVRGAKPDLTHVRTSLGIYTARNCEYGSDKYDRANYLRPVNPEGYTPETPTKADFERLRAYLRAVISHTQQALDSMERHQATDPHFVDVEGMKRAAYAVDTDETPGAKVGASKLPHVGGACASLMMAIEQAVLAGLLPADPGTPWRQ